MKTPNSEFERVACINLDRRTDRWNQSKVELGMHGIEVERVIAIEDAGRPWDGLRKTVIGIFENAMKDHVHSILILEDDIELCKDFEERFDACFQEVPQDWDMFYFSAAHQYWPAVFSSRLFRLSWSTAAHAIAFHNRCFQRVYSALSMNEQAIDVTYSSLQKDLMALCCIDPIGWQRRGHSDIEGEEKWYPYLKDIGFYDEYTKGSVTVDGIDKLTGKQRF